MSLSALRAGPSLPSRRFLLVISERLSQPQGHSVAGRIRSIEKSNHFIGNRTRDLSACSIVPQPTTLPRVPLFAYIEVKEHTLHPSSGLSSDSRNVQRVCVPTQILGRTLNIAPNIH
jgi:hypothetical protein